jgi:uncharacterized iron-regulated membrane protein
MLGKLPKFSRLQIRQAVLAMHRYLGILTGIVLVIISLTGGFLVFHEELDLSLNPQFLRVNSQGEMLSPQRVTEIARTEFPSLQVHRITVPRQPNQVYSALMTSSTNDEAQTLDVYIHPYTGHILGSRLENYTPYGFLLNLHMSLIMGEIGKLIVGICGIALLLLSVTGIILWNSGKHLIYGFRIRWKAPWKLITYDLHRVGGIVSVILLSITAITGVVLIFWLPFETIIYWATNSHRSTVETSKIIAGVQPMQIDVLLQKVQALFPGTELYRFYPSKTLNTPFDVWLWSSQENPFNRSIFMHVDPYTAKVLEVHDPRNSLVDRILNAPYVLHVGHYGGFLTKIIYFLIGLAPLGLLSTGVIIFQQRRWAMSRSTAAKEMR